MCSQFVTPSANAALSRGCTNENFCLARPAPRLRIHPPTAALPANGPLI